MTAAGERKCVSVKKNTIVDRLAAKLAAAAVLLLGLSCISAGCSARTPVSVESGRPVGAALLQELGQAAAEILYRSYMPCISFAEEGDHETFWLLQEQIDGLLPLYGFSLESMEGGEREAMDIREILLAEAEEGTYWVQEEYPEGISPETDNSLKELLQEENQAALDSQAPDTYFVPHSIQTPVDLAALEAYEDLVSRFYTVDPTTMVGSDQLNAVSFLEKDMTISKEGEGPQILIYHTHSQEAFADSVPGDTSTSIVGVGERLTQILTETYGYQVLHHTAGYDVESRNDAYSKALPEIEKLLRDNPSIQVVIDLHRDAMPESTRLVTELDGRPTARFMFFNGLSRTKKTGNIEYLYNKNLDDNLAFSFQMQLKAMEYYPGLTRKIYLKGYRYNMHLCPKYLLIELGAQNNTVEEAMNACDPLAHILDMVLSSAGESE